eukprot:scaffold8314_cov57-Attheya_sp.AAC.4
MTLFWAREHMVHSIIVGYCARPQGQLHRDFNFCDDGRTLRLDKKRGNNFDKKRGNNFDKKRGNNFETTHWTGIYPVSVFAR